MESESMKFDECPRCNPFETNHNYHCKKCGHGFETMSQVVSHAKSAHKPVMVLAS